MTNDPDDENALEALFQTARDHTPEMDDAFAARLMPASADSETAGSVSRRHFSLRNWLPAIGGLGMVAALGVWIGVVVPLDTLLNFATLSGTDTLDLSAFYTGADPGLFFGDETGL